AQIILYKNSALRGGPGIKFGKQNAKSNKRPGQSRTATAGIEKSERLPRSSLETFPLRQRRDDERPVLGLSGQKDAQTQFPHALDPALERRRPRQWHDLQPVRRRLKSSRY